jgi:hypothetical protein
MLQAQAPPQSASIAGVVVRAGTNEPIPRVRITIFRSDVPADRIPAVTSDEQGRFLFRDLSAGRYSLALNVMDSLSNHMGNANLAAAVAAPL